MLENYEISHISKKESDSACVAFMNKVYGWMVAGLAVTGLTSLAVVSSGFFTVLLENSWIMWACLIGTFAIVIGINSAMNRLGKAALGGLFFVFSALFGVSLSTIFLVYTASSIAMTFFTTAAMFAAMSVFGAVTKKNLTGMGNFMMMGLFGIIIVSIVNIFMASPALNFAVSLFGVVIFAGLTAWDTQKLKSMALIQFEDSSFAGKLVIMGALTLYLDFINLFLHLLNFMGGSRD